jgi:hypothetical protein
MRTIKVYSTSTGLAQLQSAATTWGQLMSDLANNGIQYHGMKAVESKNNTSLERDDAILPTDSFVLMLSPEKTKSGGYRETRDAIQLIIAKYGIVAKNHFNSSKNYTLKSASELEILLDSWYETFNEEGDDEEDELDELEAIVQRLRNSYYYDEREDDFELAIDLIYGNTSVQKLRLSICKDALNDESLSSEERNWILKMLSGL